MGEERGRLIVVPVDDSRDSIRTLEVSGVEVSISEVCISRVTG